MSESNRDQIAYLLKQLPSAYAINTDYGDIVLDAELRAAVVDALKPIIERRLRK